MGAVWRARIFRSGKENTAARYDYALLLAAFAARRRRHFLIPGGVWEHSCNEQICDLAQIAGMGGDRVPRTPTKSSAEPGRGMRPQLLAAASMPGPCPAPFAVPAAAAIASSTFLRKRTAGRLTPWIRSVRRTGRAAPVI